MSGCAEFKLVLFKGQLYSVSEVCSILVLLFRWFPVHIFPIINNATKKSLAYH